MSTTSAGTGGPSSIMEGKIPVFVFPVQLGMTELLTIPLPNLSRAFKPKILTHLPIVVVNPDPVGSRTFSWIRFIFGSDSDRSENEESRLIVNILLFKIIGSYRVDCVLPKRNEQLVYGADFYYEDQTTHKRVVTIYNPYEFDVTFKVSSLKKITTHAEQWHLRSGFVARFWVVSGEISLRRKRNEIIKPKQIKLCRLAVIKK